METKPLSNKEIQNILPQSPPFLFVDKIIEITENYAVGIKNVTCSEFFLQGHFSPKDPIFPGVLIIEACSQVGGVFISKKFSNKGRGYIAKVDDFKFLSFVYPGDTIVMKTMFKSAFQSFVQVNVEAFVDKKRVCKGIIQYYFDQKE